MLASWKGVHFRIKEFHVMLLLLEVGVVGVFLSLDMFLFFLFWEIMLIPMAFLIGIWGHDRRIYAAVKFVIYTMAGSILMLVGIIWLYNATGTFDLPTIQLQCSIADSYNCQSGRKYCCSWRSLWRLRSRCRCSRCTPGCPTRTWKRRRPGPLFWLACC